MIRALFKFAKIPDFVEGKKPIVIDTTSGSGEYRDLSPFILSTPPAKRFENLWQFSKVYPDQVYTEDNSRFLIVKGNPTNEWFWWRKEGFEDTIAHRYPKGKGAIPLYSIMPSYGDNRISEHLDYIQARKKIYAPEYAKNVLTTTSFHRLKYAYVTCLDLNKELILLDYDAYDHLALGMSLIDVINNPNRKMGHALVLIMMLTGLLEECINS